MHGFQWSFSSLKQFINCPKQYHEVKVLRNFVVQETEQIRYGKEVHKALEEYVRDRTPLPKNYQHFAKYADPMITASGEKYVELQMALDVDLQPCDFDSPDYWVRGIADILVVDGDTAWVADYKTGSAKYPDPKQLKLMALMVFAKFPSVETVKGALLFIAHDAAVFEQYTRGQISKLWGEFTPAITRLNAAYTNGSWPANPTGLCGWCPVKSCEFHKER